MVRSTLSPVGDSSAHMVQSCITNVSFPQNLEDLRKMVKKNRGSRHGPLDLDALLEFHPRHQTTWSAPRWMTEGDILFFYHAASAKARIARLQKEVKPSIFRWNDLVPILEHAADLANLYSRSIFACGEVSGPSEYDDDALIHIRGRIFAPLRRVHIFQSPLSLDHFADCVKITPAGTLTPLYGHQFEAIKERLAERNVLPQFLQTASARQLDFRRIDQTNWRQVACAPGIKFIDEAQIREYLLNYLLAELKDDETPLLQECRCSRQGHSTGFADYFISIYGRWIPVEAKLSVLSESDIIKQVGKYIHVDSFTPTKGVRNKTYSVADSSICLVIDHLGIYLISERQFVDCAPGKPMWKREQLQTITISEMREQFRRFL